MPKVKPPNYKFCPFCGIPLKTKAEEGSKRKFCPKDSWTYYPHVALATGAVIVNNNKVLMVKRAKEPYKGTWMFPAGFMSYGEHPMDTVKREVAEETGLKVNILKFIELDQVFDDPRATAHLTFFYKCAAKGEPINKDNNENLTVEWKDISSSLNIGWRGHKKLFKKLQNGKI